MPYIFIASNCINEEFFLSTNLRTYKCINVDLRRGNMFSFIKIDNNQTINNHVHSLENVTNTMHFHNINFITRTIYTIYSQKTNTFSGCHAFKTLRVM